MKDEGYMRCASHITFILHPSSFILSLLRPHPSPFSPSPFALHLRPSPFALHPFSPSPFSPSSFALRPSPFRIILAVTVQTPAAAPPHHAPQLPLTALPGDMAHQAAGDLPLTP